MRACCPAGISSATRSKERTSSELGQNNLQRLAMTPPTPRGGRREPPQRVLRRTDQLKCCGNYNRLLRGDRWGTEACAGDSFLHLHYWRLVQLWRLLGLRRGWKRLIDSSRADGPTFTWRAHRRKSAISTGICLLRKFKTPSRQSGYLTHTSRSMTGNSSGRSRGKNCGRISTPNTSRNYKALPMA